VTPRGAASPIVVNSQLPARRALQAGFLLLALAVCAILWNALHQPAEPQLNGKPLSHYLDNQTYGELRTERDARESIRDFGTSAVPHLIQLLERRETRITVWLRDLAQRQSFVRLRFTSLALRQSQAALACAELGPLAAPAISALSNFTRDPILAAPSIHALAMIGSQNFLILTNCLLDGIAPAREMAAGVLRHTQPRTKPLPVLLQALRDPLPSVRANAASSLGYLGAEPASTVPALIACLDDSNHVVRAGSVQGLGWFQHHALPAVPRLLELRRGEDSPEFKLKIEEAIHSIDPHHPFEPDPNSPSSP
jgi:HEAT repeat protein